MEGRKPIFYSSMNVTMADPAGHSHRSPVHFFHV